MSFINNQIPSRKENIRNILLIGEFYKCLKENQQYLKTLGKKTEEETTCSYLLYEASIQYHESDKDTFQRQLQTHTPFCIQMQNSLIF